jgi:hypothetical protein
MRPINAGWAKWFGRVQAPVSVGDAAWPAGPAPNGLIADSWPEGKRPAADQQNFFGRALAWLAVPFIAALVSTVVQADPARLPVVAGGERLLELNLDLSTSIGAVRTLSWSPDGRRLATGSADNTARIWDGQSGAEVAVLKGHSDRVLSVAWSPDGRRLATGSDDNTARIWDGQSGAEIAVLKGHSNSVLSVAWSPDGRRLATGSGDNTARIWDGQSGEPALLLLGGEGERWLGCRLTEKTCLRFDDGTLVRVLDGAFVRSLSPPPSATPPAFDLVRMADNISIADGEQRRFPVQVRNNGGNAFRARLHLFPAGESQGQPVEAPLALPPIYAAAGDATPMLSAGEEATLETTIVGAATELNPVPVTMQFRLVIEHAGAAQDLGMVMAELRAPSLAVAEAELRRGKFGSSLRVRVVNDGTLPALGLIAGVGTSNPVLIDRIDPAAISSSEHGSILFDVSDTQSQSLLESQKVTLSLQTDFTRTVLSRGGGNDPTPAEGADSRVFRRMFHTWTIVAPATVTDVPLGATAVTLAALAAGLLAVIIYGATVLYNPLLRRVSVGPDGLLAAGIEDLPQAKWLLRLAFRLKSALAGANITGVRLDEAIAFVYVPEPEPRAKALAERLELDLQGKMETTARGTALFDATTSERLLLNLPRVRLAFPRSGMGADDVLADLRRFMAASDRITVIVPADPQQNIALRAVTSGRTEQAATLSGVEMTRIFLSPRPLTVFAQALSEQVPPARLSAYHRGGGVSRAGAFFGREKEIATVLNREPANYFLVGGRQVGKTSLLKELKRRIDARGEIDCDYLSLKDDDLRGPLVDALRIDPNSTLEAAYARLTKTAASRRYLFVDEADQFILREARTGYRNLAMFRRLSEEGRAYFIFAGYWDLYRTMVFEYNSPLRNFGEQIRLGTLDEEACRRLATEPMAALNLHYEEPGLVTEIFRATAGRANLMTTACDEIIKSLSHRERTISRALVNKVLHGFELRSQLEGWDDLSRSDSPAMRANRLDRIVVYSTAHADEFTFQDIQRTFAGAGLDYRRTKSASRSRD